MKPVRAYSMVAHGVCWGLPQTSASVPLLETILFWLMIGSQPLYSALSACPLLYTLLVGVVEPQFSNGDCVMALPLKNTSFPLPFVAVFPSKKQNVMNFTPLIQVKVFVQHSAAPPREDDALVNLLFMNWQSLTKNFSGLFCGGVLNVREPVESLPVFAMHLHLENRNWQVEVILLSQKYQPVPHQLDIEQFSTLFSEKDQSEVDCG